MSDIISMASVFDRLLADLERVDLPNGYKPICDRLARLRNDENGRALRLLRAGKIDEANAITKEMARVSEAFHRRLHEIVAAAGYTPLDVMAMASGMEPRGKRKADTSASDISQKDLKPGQSPIAAEFDRVTKLAAAEIDRALQCQRDGRHDEAREILANVEAAMHPCGASQSDGAEKLTSDAHNDNEPPEEIA